MAGKVFFSVTMSLDGFVAPEERRDDPDVQRAVWAANQSSRASGSSTLQTGSSGGTG
jgi:hypothetical protein